MIDFENILGEEIMDDLSETLRNLAITKRLNFLIGSGASTPAISLMSQVKVTEKEIRAAGTKKEAKNIKLIEKIKEVSGELLHPQKNTTNKNKQIQLKLEEYKRLIKVISEILNQSNSREIPREANIFTTNYDLFIEKAVDEVLAETTLVFNDGARGYFNRYLDSSNFNRTVSYEGLNNNYIDELPSLTLIKPHGSVNWKREGKEVQILNSVIDEPMVVPPTGFEGRDTFLDDHFHDMLRVFQLELDKPESVLFVFGFSFQDDHIARMLRRALRNRSLIIACFCWQDSDKITYRNNLGYKKQEPPKNLKFIKPSQFKNKNKLELKDLTDVLKGDL